MERLAMSHINRKDLQLKRKMQGIEEAEAKRFKDEIKDTMDGIGDAVQNGLVEETKLTEQHRKKVEDEKAKAVAAAKKMDKLW